MQMTLPLETDLPDAVAEAEHRAWLMSAFPPKAAA
jgi:hypothetical protein